VVRRNPKQVGHFTGRRPPVGRGEKHECPEGEVSLRRQSHQSGRSLNRYNPYQLCHFNDRR
jgi:hypothetical protein